MDGTFYHKLIFFQCRVKKNIQAFLLFLLLLFCFGGNSLKKKTLLSLDLGGVEGLSLPQPITVDFEINPPPCEQRRAFPQVTGAEEEAKIHT